jgi:hypothetical protein
MNKPQTLNQLIEQLSALKEPDIDTVEEYFHDFLKNAEGCIRLGTNILDIFPISENSGSFFTLKPSGLAVSCVNEENEVIKIFDVSPENINFSDLAEINIIEDFRSEGEINEAVEGFKNFIQQLSISSNVKNIIFSFPSDKRFINAFRMASYLKGRISKVTFDLDKFLSDERVSKKLFYDDDGLFAFAEETIPGLYIEERDTVFQNLCISGTALESLFNGSLSLYEEDNCDQASASSCGKTEDELIIEILSKKPIDFNSFLDLLLSQLPQNALQESESEIRLRVFNKVQELVTEGKVKKDGKKYKVKK